jgi:hypothetical protein
MLDPENILHIGHGLPRLPLGTVYYVACSETRRLKIGYASKSVESRLKNLQTGAAGELVLIATQPGTKEDEAALHRHFDSQRLHGEWFEMNEALFDHICEVVWNAAHFIVKQGLPVPRWMPLSLRMLEFHTGVELPPELHALI